MEHDIPVAEPTCLTAVHPLSGLICFTIFLIISLGLRVVKKKIIEIQEGDTAGRYSREIRRGDTAGRYGREIRQADTAA